MKRHSAATAPRSARAKLITQSQAARKALAARRRGERVVLTNGCFDLLHVGHVRCLEQARGHGDMLIVALNADASVRAIKGPERPIVPDRQRAELIGALECVDWVVLFRGKTPLAPIQAIRPDVLAKGGDWRLEEIVGRSEVEAWGGRVLRLKHVAGAGTSAIIQRVRSSS